MTIPRVPLATRHESESPFEPNSLTTVLDELKGAP
ncbi:unnamed protein product, partial [Adineta steineri]